jgi:hypothetical protein
MLYIKHGKLLMPFTKEPLFEIITDIYTVPVNTYSSEYDLKHIKHIDDYVENDIEEHKITNKVYRDVEINDIKKALLFTIDELSKLNNNKPIPLVQNGKIYNIDRDELYKTLPMLSITDEILINTINCKPINIKKSDVDDIMSVINERNNTIKSTRQYYIDMINDMNDMKELLSFDITDQW